MTSWARSQAGPDGRPVIDAGPAVAVTSPPPAAVPPASGAPPHDAMPGDRVGGEPVPGDRVGGEPVGGLESWRSGLLQAGPLAVAGLAANAANVVVTVVLARLLVARGYGALNQLTGVFLVVSTPGAAVIVAVVRRLTSWETARGGDVCRWARRLHRQGAVALVLFAVAVVCAGPALAGLLGRSGAAGVDAATLAGAVRVLLCLDRGLLQAHRDYRTLSVNLLFEGGLRTAAMLTLVGAGAGVSGAAAGMLVAEIGTALHARVMADRAWSPPAGAGAAIGDDGDGGGARPRVAGRRRAVAELATALVALAMIALLQNEDVIVMGREGPSADGAYAAVSVSTKVLVFAALVIGGYLLPEAAIRWRDGAHALRQLVVTLLLLAVPGLAIVAVSLGAPRLFLSVMFGGRYMSASGAFFPLALAMVFLSTTVVLTLYLLAVGDRRIAWVLTAGAVAGLVAVASADGHPQGTALADLAVQAAVLAVAVGDLVAVHRARSAVAGHGVAVHTLDQASRATGGSRPSR
jgi:O-antigen/teichoic acid export membrane protein